MNNILNVICAGAIGSVAYLLCALIVIIAVIAEVFAVLIFLNYRNKKEKDLLKQDLPLQNESNIDLEEEEILNNVTESDSETIAEDTNLGSLDLENDKADLDKPLSFLSEEEKKAIFDEVFVASVPPIDGSDVQLSDTVNSESDSFAAMEEVCATDDSIGAEEQQGYAYSDDQYNTDSGEYTTYNVGAFFAEQDRVRYIRSFTAKLSQSNDLLKERYNVLKNELMSYKKVKARKSWYSETFRLGRPVIAKFAIIGKTLSLYLALSPEEFIGSKYVFKDVSAVKKYSAVPMRLKIKSNRSVRYAKELIQVMAKQYGWKSLNLQEVDYYPEYRTTEELIMDKEIKIVVTEKTNAIGGNDNDFEDINETKLSETAAAEGFTAYTDPLAVIMEVDLDETSAEEQIEKPVEEVAVAAESVEEQVEEAEVVAEEITEEPVEETEVVAEEPADENSKEPAEEPVVELPERDFEFVSEVSVTSADKEMTDEKAESLIETLSVSSCRYGGKGKAIVNIDTLSENYKAGEVVTLENLKAKKLVPKKADSVKVLGRGVIDKPLTVEADGFTVSAVKMILLTGGRAIRTVE